MAPALRRVRIKPSTRAALLSGTALAVAFAAIPVWANPSGGTVVGGEATITTPSSTQTDINQTTPRAIINWDDFSIQQGETTNFYQPSKTSVTLNRVVGGSRSFINGLLRATGNIFLINQNGIIIGKTGEIDANGFVASTSDIANEDFMAGHDAFSIPSPVQGAEIVNEGTVTVGEAGLAALVAPHVSNAGTIMARLGRVALAGAETFTVDLYGDGLISFDTGSPTGKPLVENSGVIKADGGTVQITARAAEEIVDNVINMTGLVQAQSVGMQDGTIVLDGGGSGGVEIAGTLDATGHGAGESGGSITVTGESVTLTEDAHLDASGHAGGGDIVVGGPKPEDGTMLASADVVHIDPGAEIHADAIHDGDGGNILFWANEQLDFAGLVTARGGAHGGDGGFVEVSSAGEVTFGDHKVDLTAPHGETGTFLIDPDWIRVVLGSYYYYYNYYYFTAYYGACSYTGASCVYEADLEFDSQYANIVLDADYRIDTDADAYYGCSDGVVTLAPNSDLLITTHYSGSVYDYSTYQNLDSGVFLDEIPFYTQGTGGIDIASADDVHVNGLKTLGGGISIVAGDAIVDDGAGIDPGGDVFLSADSIYGYGGDSFTIYGAADHKGDLVISDTGQVYGDLFDIEAGADTFDSISIAVRNPSLDFSLDLYGGDGVYLTGDGADITLDEATTTGTDVELHLANFNNAVGALIVHTGTVTAGSELGLGSYTDLVIGDGAGTAIDASVSGEKVLLIADLDGDGDGDIVDGGGTVLLGGAGVGLHAAHYIGTGADALEIESPAHFYIGAQVDGYGAGGIYIHVTGGGDAEIVGGDITIDEPEIGFYRVISSDGLEITNLTSSTYDLPIEFANEDGGIVLTGDIKAAGHVSLWADGDVKLTGDILAYRNDANDIFIHSESAGIVGDGGVVYLDYGSIGLEAYGDIGGLAPVLARSEYGFDFAAYSETGGVSFEAYDGDVTVTQVAMLEPQSMGGPSGYYLYGVSAATDAFVSADGQLYGGSLYIDEQVAAGGNIDLYAKYGGLNVGSSGYIAGGGDGTSVYLYAYDSIYVYDANYAYAPRVTNTGTGSIYLRSLGYGKGAITLGEYAIDIEEGALTISAEDGYLTGGYGDVVITADGDVNLIADFIAGDDTGASALGIAGDGSGDSTLSVHLTGSYGDLLLDVQTDQFGRIELDFDYAYNFTLIKHGPSDAIELHGAAGLLTVYDVDLTATNPEFVLDLLEADADVQVATGTLMSGTEVTIKATDDIFIGTTPGTAVDVDGTLALIADSDSSGVGGIFDGGGTVDAYYLVMHAATGIDVYIDEVKAVAAETDTGGIYLHSTQTSDLAIDSIASEYLSLDGLYAASGGIGVYTYGYLNVNEDVTAAGGGVELVSYDGAVAVQSGFDVYGTTFITLEAYDNVTVYGAIDGTYGGVDISLQSDDGAVLVQTGVVRTKGGTVELIGETDIHVTTQGTASYTHTLAAYTYTGDVQVDNVGAGEVDIGTAGATTGLTVGASALGGGEDIVVGNSAAGGSLYVNAAVDGPLLVWLYGANLEVNSTVTADVLARLTADTMAIADDVTAPDIIVENATAGTTISLNDSNGTLQLDNAELGYLVTAGSVTIGSATAGAMYFGGDGAVDITGVTWASVEFLTADHFEFNGDFVSASTALKFDGDSYLNANSEIDTTNAGGSGGAGVEFTGVIDGEYDLKVVAGAGDAIFGDDIGGVTPLASLYVTATNINLHDATTNNGNQTFIADGGAGTVTVASDYDTMGGDFSVTGTFSLSSNTTVTTGGGFAMFDGTVEGAFTLGVDTTAGTVTFTGTVGGVTPLASLEVNGGTINLASVITSGFQDYTGTTINLGGADYTTDSGKFTATGPVILLADVFVDTTDAGGSAGDDVLFDGTVDGAFDLDVDAGTATAEFTGDIGATTPLARLKVVASSIDVQNAETSGDQAFEGATNLHGTDYITDSGKFTVTGATTLFANVTVDTTDGGNSTGGDVTFDGAVDGAFDLVVDAGSTGDAEFTGAVGGLTQLASVYVEAANITLHDVTTNGTTGDQSYIAGAGSGDVFFASAYDTNGGNFLVDGNLTLQSNSTVETNGGTADFTGTVDGGFTFAVNTATGTVTFSGTVGGTTPLMSLDVDGGIVNLASVTTVGFQDYTGTTINLNGADYITDSGTFTATGAVVLLANAHVDTTDAGGSSGADVTFDGAVDGAQTLTVDAGAGNATFTGDAGGSINLTSLTVDGAVITLQNVHTTGLQDYDGTAIELHGTDYITHGATFTATGASQLFADVTVDTTNSGGSLGANITFDGTIDGAHALIVTAGAGDSDFTGDAGGLTPLTSVLVTAANIRLHDVTTNGNQTYTANGGAGTITFASDYDTNGGDFNSNGAMVLESDTTVTTDGGTANFNGTVNGGYGLQVAADTGTVNFFFDVGGVTPLASLSATGATVNLLNVTTAGLQNYAGTSAVNLGGNNYLTGGGSFTATGPAFLLADVLIGTSGGSTTFNDTLDGAYNLVVSGGAGTASFLGAVGGATPLATIAVTSANIVLHDVETTGTQTYTGATSLDGTYLTQGADIAVTGPVTLAGDATIDPTHGGSAGAGANVLLDGTVNGAHELSIASGTSGDTTITGNAGGVTRLASVNITGDVISLHDVGTSGAQFYQGSQINFASTYVTHGAAFTALGPIQLLSSTLVDTTDGGTVASGDVILGLAGQTIGFANNADLGVFAGGNATVAGDMDSGASTGNDVNVTARGGVQIENASLSGDLTLRAGYFNGNPLANAGQSVVVNGEIHTPFNVFISAPGDVTFFAPSSMDGLTILLNGTATNDAFSLLDIGHNFLIGGLSPNSGSSNLFGSILGIPTEAAASIGHQTTLPLRDKFKFNTCIVQAGCVSLQAAVTVIIPIFEPFLPLFEEEELDFEILYSDFGNLELWTTFGKETQ